MAAPKVTTKEDLEKLQAEVARLTKALAEKTEESEIHKAAAVLVSENEERPTGRSVKITRCKGYKTVGYHDDGRSIMRPEWHEVDEPTYWYTIDMPPVGGTDIKLNGKEFFHASTYEVTLDELRTLKDICWRLWAHERSIHEDNEKVFRQHFDSKLKKFFPRGAVTPKGKVIN